MKAAMPFTGHCVSGEDRCDCCGKTQAEWGALLKAPSTLVFFQCSVCRPTALRVRS